MISSLVQFIRGLTILSRLGGIEHKPFRPVPLARLNTVVSMQSERVCAVQILSALIESKIRTPACSFVNSSLLIL